MRNGDRNGSDRRAKNLERAEDLLERLEPLVRSVVAGFTRDPATADELAQACRIRIHEKRARCRDPEAVFGWAKRLCRRVCLTAAEEERRDRDRFVDDEDGVAGAATPIPDPLAAAETAEMRLRVGRAVERVPEEDRQLLKLRYWHGLGAADIARHLDMPAATVRTRLRRACLRLRRAPEIVGYAPRRPSLWSGRSGRGTMDEARHGPPSAGGRGAP